MPSNPTLWFLAADPLDLQRGGFSARVSESRFVTAAAQLVAPEWCLGSVSGTLNTGCFSFLSWRRQQYLIIFLCEILIFLQREGTVFRWEHYISFGWLYVHLRSWLQARKTEFSTAPIFQGLTHKQTFPSFATSQQNIDNCVWKGRFRLQNNPRTLTAIVCGSPLPPSMFTSSQGWQRAAAATNQPGEGGEIPGAPSPFPVSWNPQTFLFTLDHHNRFTAITSSSVNNTYSV